MDNSLARKYTFPKLILFALPNIIMMVFLSIYTIVDGIFISRYVGTTALSAVNMVFPSVSLEMALGIMLASGGSAIIAIKLGEQKEREAKENFSLIVLLELMIGILIAIIGNVFMEQIVRLLGASDAQFAFCMIYGRILFAFAPCFLLHASFQTLFITAGKPALGLTATSMGGIANMVLDYVFMEYFGMGIAGAAIATGIGNLIPSMIGLLYFGFNRKGTLYFVRPKWSGKMIRKALFNGSSEMVTNLAEGISTFLFNYTFMKFYGEDGVASITIVLYFQFVLIAIFFGYSMGVAPIISYKYGSRDTEQLKKIHKNSLIFISGCSVLSYVLSGILIKPVLLVFTNAASNVYAITLEGFWLFALSFLMMGISIYASSLFTALSDGLTSAMISFVRTLLFLVAALLLLPVIMGKMGIWIAVPAAELLGIVVSIVLLIKNRRKYQY